MEATKYVKLKTPIVRGGHLDTLDELRVKVDYQKGGFNYFSGDIESGGVYVFLTPVHRGNHFVSQTIDGNAHNSGYKILIKELNRKSQKQINIVAELIMPKAQEIADLYSTGNHREVYNLIKEISK